VAAALPGHGAEFREIRRLNTVRREAFAAALAAIGVKAHPSDANFLLCDFGRDMRPEIERLRERGILVRPCGMFPGLTHGHVRLCVRTEGENGRLVAALKGTGHD
jgi:threonine-phosphate decarboxylase